MPPILAALCRKSWSRLFGLPPAVDRRSRGLIPRILFVLSITATLAHSEHLVFTTVVPGSSPVWISAPEKSKDFGFQSLEFLNDSNKSLQSLHLKVTFTTEAREPEEVVDGGYVYTDLEPGQQKRLDVFLGRISALSQKLRSLGREVAWVKITVETVEFADGSRWDPGAPVISDPVEPVRPIK
jgi:hypothetical protein